MELTVLWDRGPRLVPRNSHLQPISQARLFPRRRAEAAASRHQQGPEHPLPRPPPDRSDRSAAARRVAETSSQAAGLGSGQEELGFRAAARGALRAPVEPAPAAESSTVIG